MQKLILLASTLALGGTHLQAKTGAELLEQFLHLKSEHAAQTLGLTQHQTSEKFDLEKRHTSRRLQLEKEQKITSMKFGENLVKKIARNKDLQSNDLIFKDATKEALASHKQQKKEWQQFYSDMEEDKAKLMKKYRIDAEKLREKQDLELAELEKELLKK
jgi:hypothetical protein